MILKVADAVATIRRRNHSAAEVAPGLRFELKSFIGVEQNSDWPFIDQFHRHHCLEHACRNRDTQPAKHFAELFIQQLCLFWRRCSNETRPTLTASVTIKCKLGHDEY